MKYQLINLDLDTNPSVREFSVGPYKIRLVDEYEKRQSNLPRLRTTARTTKYINGEPITHEEVVKEKVGRVAVTAIAECENEPSSVFYRDTAKGIGDLCLILSYLLGRRVFLPEQRRIAQHIHYGYLVMPHYEVPEAANIAWSNRASFTTESERRPFWYYLSMNDTPINDLKILLGCVSLEIMQRLKENETIIEPTQELEDLIQELRKKIEESRIAEDLKDRLKGTVGNWGRSNAQQAFKNMLANYGLIDPNISGLPLERVEGIFRMRNEIVHKGQIKLPQWVKGEAAKERTARFIGVRFIRGLISEYLNRKFQLHKFSHVRRNAVVLREYIYHGTSDGERVEA